MVSCQTIPASTLYVSTSSRSVHFHIFIIAIFSATFSSGDNGFAVTPRLSTKARPARRANGLGVLSTVFDAPNGSYGNMFDVNTTEKIRVERMDIHTDKTEMITYEIFTKKGSYVPSMRIIDDWSMIASGTVKGHGAKGPTPIPSDNFTSIIIEADIAHAFYVTLNSYDLRYSVGTKVGTVISSNDELMILEGCGVGEYPLGETFFSPRIWNGAIYYTTYAKNVTSAKTEVMFRFFVEHSNKINDSELLSIVDLAVEKYLTDIMINDDELKRLVEEGNLALVGVNSIIPTVVKVEVPCTISQPGYQCSVVESTVISTANEDFELEEIRMTLLGHAKNLSSSLGFSGNKYVGPEAVSSEFIIKLSSEHLLDLDSKMEKDFKGTVRDFVNEDSLLLIPPVDIRLVKIKSLDIVKRQGSIINLTATKRQHTPPSYVSVISLTTEITGEYQPPPIISLHKPIQDSFDRRGENFVTAVKQKKGFEGVEKISAVATQIDIQPILEEEEDEVESDVLTQVKDIFQNPLYIGIILVVVIFCCCSFGMMIICKRTSKDKKHIFLPQSEEFDQIVLPLSEFSNCRLPPSRPNSNKSMGSHPSLQFNPIPSRPNSNTSMGSHPSLQFNPIHQCPGGPVPGGFQ